MATGSLMKTVRRGSAPATKSKAPARLLGCIVVTPSNDFPLWVGAIEAAAAAAGLKVALDGGKPVVDTEHSILITANPSRALAVDASHLVVLISDLDGAARAGAMAVAGNMTAGAVHASLVIAEALMLPGAIVVTADDARKDSVSFWPGLSVVPPPSSSVKLGSDEESAWAQAMSLYRGGLPACGSKVRWEPPIFRFDQAGAELRGAPWELDVVGPARHLVYGPYFTLTPGRWRGSLRFAVDDHAAQLRYRVEWGGLSDHATETFTPGRSGVFELALECNLADPVPVELRIIQAQGSLGGTFELLGMVLERTT